VHCGSYPGGECNEPTGIGAATQIPDQSWHTWRIQFDRRSNNWRTETITWFLDGQQFHQITGARVNNEATWNALCHSPLFFILNVAVGGNWVSFHPLALDRIRQDTKLAPSPGTPTATPSAATAP
jgi:hypothetical protein